MKTWLQQLADRLTTSFWFVPAAMAAAALLLAFALLYIDEYLKLAWPEWVNQWMSITDIDSSRALFSSMAASIITVLGVVFSITIVALTLAASQLGPRLLRNFMRDKVNQLVLGVFVATFIYFQVLLLAMERVITSDPKRLPQLTTMVALLLGLISLAMLIYFMHHLAKSIQAPHVLMVVSKELRQTIDRVLPDCLDEHRSDGPANSRPDSAPETEVPITEPPWSEAASVSAPDTGYLQAVDLKILMSLAVKHDLQIRLVCQPGDFVVQDEPLIRLLPAQQLSDELTRKLHDSLYIGAQRSATQDLDFVIQELVEVALRALSPSINDPFTAGNALDYIGDAMLRIAQRHMPPSGLRDQQGRLRVIMRRTDFRGLCDISFDQIRHNATRSPATLVRIMENLIRIARRTTLPDRKEVLWHQGLMTQRVGAALAEPYDRHRLEQRFYQLRSILQPGSDSINLPECL